MRSVYTGLLFALALAAPAKAEPWRVHDALNLPDWLTVSGDFRVRYEALDGQFRPGLNGSDQDVSLRTQLLVEAHFKHVRVGGELIDSRAYLDDRASGLSEDDVNALEPVQAYVGVHGKVGGVVTDAQFGRFTMGLGSQRLAGRHQFRNTTNAFTGARLDFHKDDSTLTFFYTLPQRRLPNDREGILSNDIKLDAQNFDQRFWGAFFHQNKLPLDLQGEAFVFRLAERDEGGFQTPNRELYTGGARLLRSPKPGRFDVELEGGLQRGSRFATANPLLTQRLAVRAAYAHLEAGYSWKGKVTPRAALLYDFGSGDKNPNDGQFNRFDSLFGPRRPDYGERGIFNAVPFANIQAPGARFVLDRHDKWNVQVLYHATFLDESRDAFAQGIRDLSGQSGVFAGHLVDVSSRVWLVPGSFYVDVGGAALLDGNFQTRAPNGTDAQPLYGFAESVWRF